MYIFIKFTQNLIISQNSLVQNAYFLHKHGLYITYIETPHTARNVLTFSYLQIAILTNVP